VTPGRRPDGEGVDGATAWAQQHQAAFSRCGSSGAAEGEGTAANAAPMVDAYHWRPPDNAIRARITHQHAQQSPAASADATTHNWVGNVPNKCA
jgi:hypothetical protein